jgi:hypothetical protein
VPPNLTEHWSLMSAVASVRSTSAAAMPFLDISVRLTVSGWVETRISVWPGIENGRLSSTRI